MLSLWLSLTVRAARFARMSDPAATCIIIRGTLQLCGRSLAKKHNHSA